MSNSSSCQASWQGTSKTLRFLNAGRTPRPAGFAFESLVFGKKCLSILLFSTLVWPLFLGCQPKPEVHSIDSTDNASNQVSATTEIQFRDVTSASGIDFIHQTGAEGQLFLAEAMTGGLAVFDYDNDGWEDIYFCSGHSLNPATETTINETGVFFANRGGLVFRDVSADSGLADHGYCLGVTVGDYNNDGFADIYISRWGENQLLRNNGDGTFSDVTCSVTSGGDRFGAGVCMADINQNGGLDLVVGNYVEPSRSNPKRGTGSGQRSTYPGPLDFPPETIQLLLNQQDGTWIDASDSSGLSAFKGTAMAIITGDFDDDGHCDIYVANDEMPNHLFINDGHGVFSEVGYAMGVAVDNQGRVNGSMGIDCADVDLDGLPDLIVTSYENELVTLYQMKSHGTFENATHSSQIGRGTAPHVTWGCSFGDFDNDGDVDVYVASGHIDFQSPVYKIADLVFENKFTEVGKAQFELVTQSSGDVSRIAESARGTAVSDLDNDGDLDVVVLNSQARCTILENTLANKKNWIAIRLIGTRANRSAIGAKVVYQAGGKAYADEVRSGQGYQSYWGERIHFGLGDNADVGTLRIAWPGGAEQVIEAVSPNQLLHVIQEAR